MLRRGRPRSVQYGMMLNMDEQTLIYGGDSMIGATAWLIFGIVAAIACTALTILFVDLRWLCGSAMGFGAAMMGQRAREIVARR